MAVAFLENWNFWGVVLDILGAGLLVWGELSGEMAMIRYQATGDFERFFESEVMKRSFWKRWMLRLGRRCGPSDPQEMSPLGLFDSFPIKAWGFTFLVLGFCLQAIGSLKH